MLARRTICHAVVRGLQCFCQFSGEFVLASLAASSLHVTRLYGFRLRIQTKVRLQNVRAEVEVALTERLFARWTIRLAASLFCQLCGENIAELLTCLCIPGPACRGKARHQPSEVFMFPPNPFKDEEKNGCRNKNTAEQHRQEGNAIVHIQRHFLHKKVCAHFR